uniref:G_PROTEIN_RECEP_F1_2 domain-containing protein n=1 Tax=Ascaris lumbricoides TaxID=6252 RepID=A0A0M3IU00_ASCLU
MDEALRIMRFPLIFTSIVGNFAVLIVLLRYRALRKSSSNMLIAQLAFSGLIVGKLYVHI